MSKRNKMYEIYHFDLDNELLAGYFFEGTERQAYDAAIKEADPSEVTQFIVLEEGETPVLAGSKQPITNEEFWPQVIHYRGNGDLIPIPKKKKLEKGNKKK